MKIQNKLKIAVFTALAVLAGSGAALSSTFEGTVQGLTCVLHGTLCPVDRSDPHVTAEHVFVIQSEDNSYKLVPNLARATLLRFLGHQVRISGDHHPTYNAIEAETLEVMKQGGYRTVWSLEAELEEQKQFDAP